MPSLGALALATALAAAVLALTLSLLARSSTGNSPSTATDARHWQPCIAPGPVLATRIANLDLDGLTVIPVCVAPASLSFFSREDG